MTLKQLPLGDQSFAEIIDGNFLYADKTRYIHELIRSPMRNYFLSRPRRLARPFCSAPSRSFSPGIAPVSGVFGLTGPSPDTIFPGIRSFP